ncbi:MAG: UbiX family flavin prenyltransferase [Rikenellaceae bacterium]
MNIVVGVTGASGAIYARRLIERILTESKDKEEHQISVVFSSYGLEVAKFEGEYENICNQKITIYDANQMFSTIASGSSKIDAMVVVPCSVSSLGRIASGCSDNLLTRSADVMIKERRKLIIALRETPLSLIHIENMLRVTTAGAIVMPLSPSFYSKPTTIEELVDTQVDRIASLLGIELGQYIFN